MVLCFYFKIRIGGVVYLVAAFKKIKAEDVYKRQILSRSTLLSAYTFNSPGSNAGALMTDVYKRQSMDNIRVISVFKRI